MTSALQYHTMKVITEAGSALIQNDDDENKCLMMDLACTEENAPSIPCSVKN